VELSDQVAIVTGAGQGIGKAAALAAAGAHVLASDINGASAEETAAATLRKRVPAPARRSAGTQGVLSPNDIGLSIG
jgi:NAD(P)-dependent dehydrogenase (short-subunit alcohol dehydrogenase family)